jgi:hypothetical protein
VKARNGKLCEFLELKKLMRKMRDASKKLEDSLKQKEVERQVFQDRTNAQTLKLITEVSDLVKAQTSCADERLVRITELEEEVVQFQNISKELEVLNSSCFYIYLHHLFSV